jgi:thioesterase domain-containing protein
MSSAGASEYRTVEDMAAAHLAEMRSVQPTGPYLLLGSCFGGQVAYTMARMLHENGDTVDLLVMVDPPTLGWEGVAHWRHRPWTWEFVRGWTRRKIIRIARSRKRRQLVESGEVQRRHEILTLSRRANREFAPVPSPVPMVVLAARLSKPRQEWYWTPLAVGGLEVEEFKFGHTEMYGPQGRRAIAKILQRHLDKVDIARPG